MEELRQIETRIDALKRDTALNLLQIGDELKRAKAIIPHGQFEAWLTNNVKFSTRTARLLMQTAAAIDPAKRQALADLPITKLYLIAQAPEEQRIALIEAAHEPSTRELQSVIKGTTSDIESYRVLPDGFVDACKRIIDDNATDIEALTRILEILKPLAQDLAELAIDAEMQYGKLQQGADR